jgi:hypothetical protein
MTALSVGQAIEVPGLPGRWQVWSQSAEQPGAYFVVQGGQVATVKARRVRGVPFPQVELLHGPAKESRR